MKKGHVNLSESDKQELKELLSKGVLKVRVQKRAVALQMLDKGMSYQEVKKHLKVSHITLSIWAKRYRSEGLKMLHDRPRSGRPLSISGRERAKVTALACTKPPKGHARWTLRLLSDRLVELDLVDSISHTKVAQILKKTDFSPIAKNNGV